MMLSIKARHSPSPRGVSVVKTQDANNNEWTRNENSIVGEPHHDEPPHDDVPMNGANSSPSSKGLHSSMSRSKPGSFCLASFNSFTPTAGLEQEQQEQPAFLQQQQPLLQEENMQQPVCPASTSTNSSSSSISSTNAEENTFAESFREQTNGSEIPVFDKGLRAVMEPHLRIARLQREMSRNRTYLNYVDASIASSVGVPYTRLRVERRFLFDEHTHPLHQLLSELLNVTDLSMLHQVQPPPPPPLPPSQQRHLQQRQQQEQDKRYLMKALLDRSARRRFHECYDSFVTSLCIPLLHSMGMQENIFHTTSKTASNRITYRYQAFPTIQILRPGDLPSSGPRCAGANGHSIGCLTFHIPLSSSFGTNAMYVESHPGREDWHPLSTKSVGLGYLFDGARCLHFDLINTTNRTRVSLEFTVLIYRDGDHNITTSDGLCGGDSLEDSFSLKGPGYYEEATIDLGVHAGGYGMVAKKKHYHGHLPDLLDPNYLNGFPFA